MGVQGRSTLAEPTSTDSDKAFPRDGLPNVLRRMPSTSQPMALPSHVPLALDFGYQQALCKLAVEVAEHHTTFWYPKPWFLNIPCLTLSKEYELSLFSCLNAVAIGCRMVNAGDGSMSTKAREFYAAGLRAQRKHLLELQDTKGQVASAVIHGVQQDRDKLMALLIIAMLLVEFEMMQPSSCFSWCTHAIAATEILKIIGPEICQESPFHELFLLLRHMMVYVSIVTNTDTCFSSSAWINIPFETRDKSPYNHVIDTLLGILYSSSKDLYVGSEETGTESVDQKQLLEMLNTLRNIPLRPLEEIVSPGSNTSDLNTQPEILMVLLRATGTIMLYHKLSSLTISLDEFPQEEVICLGDHILSIAMHINRHTTFSVILQIMFGMHIIAIFSPSPAQKYRAMNIFMEWQSNTVGWDGIKHT
ncbi:hypothetical protein F5884DRAFT_261046 [Xylogone sp. PMI_703]|nr:hypothetical protein F5884DRAFT_261046 [Xylogone sp. PMI_703]